MHISISIHACDIPKKSFVIRSSLALTFPGNKFLTLVIFPYSVRSAAYKEFVNPVITKFSQIGNVKNT